MSRWTDKLLARRILSGDGEACRNLVAGYHAPIYGLLARLCRDGHLAEDLTQETFAAAWANIGGYTASSSLSTWLHTIAYRKFLDFRRRRGWAAEIDPNQNVDELGSACVGPLEIAIADDEARRLRGALARLPPAERDVLVLHYLQGLSYREMAQVLEEPSGTVKWRTSRALDKLKQLLEDGSDEDAKVSGSDAVRRAVARQPLATVAPPGGA